MADQYDLIVLGSGPGGYVAAIRAAQLGMKVAIVERERLGGICLNWGCIPTKALLRTSEIYHYMQHADAYGLSASNVAFDLTKVVERSRKVAGQLNAGVKGLMKKNKITVVEGFGTITGTGALSVKQGDKTTDLAAKNIIVATGARARDLPFAKADGERIWTYRHAMTPPEMPTKLLVIGSGRDRRGVRQLLQRHGRRRDDRRDARPDPAGGGCRGFGLHAQGTHQAEDPDPHRRRRGEDRDRAERCEGRRSRARTAPPPPPNIAM